jgi:hypothetical protein
MPVRNRFVTCFVAWIALDLACELVELSELVSSQVTFDRLALLVELEFGLVEASRLELALLFGELTEGRPSVLYRLGGVRVLLGRRQVLLPSPVCILHCLHIIRISNEHVSSSQLHRQYRFSSFGIHCTVRECS